MPEMITFNHLDDIHLSAKTIGPTLPQESQSNLSLLVDDFTVQSSLNCLVALVNSKLFMHHLLLCFVQI